ncbi:MAG: hypothetical protein AAF570_12475 [Bacteroidota bacterium]
MNISSRRAMERWKNIALLAGCFLLLFGSGAAYAQSPSTPDSSAHFSRWALQTAIGNQTVGFPMQNFGGALNPVFPVLGVDFRLNKNEKHALSIGLTNSWTFNRENGNQLNASLYFQYAFIHRSGVFGGLGIHLGNTVFFHRAEAFQYNAETQGYDTAENRFAAGSSGFLLSLGYDMRKASGHPFSLFLRNRFHFQSPYFSSDLFPVLPTNVLEIGFTYHIPKRKTQP